MKVVVLTSGGLDSSVLLHHHVYQGDEVRAIAFNYGQRHVKELSHIQVLAKMIPVPFTEVDLSSLAPVLPGSSQTDGAVTVPYGKYDEASMKSTVVPNRNMILLSVAIGHAIAYRMDAVSYAAHAGDHAIYPDCRPDFASIMEQAAQVCDWKRILLLRPFIHKSKADIVRYGKELEVPFFQTWSCYEGGKHHCGRCGTCIERREAFYLAKVTDPTLYAPTAPSLEEMIKHDWHLPASS